MMGYHVLTMSFEWLDRPFQHHFPSIRNQNSLGHEIRTKCRSRPAIGSATQACDGCQLSVLSPLLWLSNVPILSSGSTVTRVKNGAVPQNHNTISLLLRAFDERHRKSPSVRSNPHNCYRGHTPLWLQISKKVSTMQWQQRRCRKAFGTARLTCSTDGQ